MSATSLARQVLAVKYGHRVTTRAESYLNFHLYGERTPTWTSTTTSG